MKTLIDIGNAHAGILITYDEKRREFTVLSHGKQDRREVTFDDPIDASTEAFIQSHVLRLHTRLSAISPSLHRYLADKAREGE